MDLKSLQNLKDKRENLDTLSYYTKHNGWWDFLANIMMRCV